MRWLIRDGQRRKRAPEPEQLRFLASPPSSDEGVALCARAFAELQTTRPRYTMFLVRNGQLAGSAAVPGAIPWDKMLAWCRWHRLDRQVTNHVMNAIAIVDAQLRKRETDKLKSMR